MEIDLVGGGSDPRVLGEVEHVPIDDLPPETLPHDLPGLPSVRRGLVHSGLDFPLAAERDWNASSFHGKYKVVRLQLFKWKRIFDLRYSAPT